MDTMSEGVEPARLILSKPFSLDEAGWKFGAADTCVWNQARSDGDISKIIWYIKDSNNFCAKILTTHVSLEY